jgi:hypothetical protein
MSDQIKYMRFNDYNSTIVNLEVIMLAEKEVGRSERHDMIKLRMDNGDDVTLLYHRGSEIVNGDYSKLFDALPHV